MAEQRQSSDKQSEGDPFAFLLIAGIGCLIALVTGVALAWMSGNLGVGLLSALAGTISGAASYLIGWQRGPARAEGCLLYILPLVLPIVVTAGVARGLSLGQPDSISAIGGGLIVVAMILRLTRSR